VFIEGLAIVVLYCNLWSRRRTGLATDVAKTAAQNFAIDQIALAECYFLRGDIASAVEQTNLALNALEQSQSRRPTDRLGELFHQAKQAPRCLLLSMSRVEFSRR
jgi:hypothetical protein